MTNKLMVTMLLLVILLKLPAQEIRTLSLQECVDIAIENNLTVQRSLLSLETAEVNREQARAQRYPSLNLNGNYGFNWGRGIDPTTNQFINQRIGFSGINGSANVALINGMQVTNSIRQSSLDVDVANYDLARTKNDISLSVATIYLNVIFNKELLENARFQLESSQQQLEQTKKLVASGALPISNELQLVSQVATNEVNLITNENNLDLALLDLKQALLLPSREDIDIVVPELTVDRADLDDLTVEDIYKIALSTQPEIQSADTQVKSAVVGMGVSKGGLYPSLNLNGSFSTNYSDAVSETFSPNGDSLTLSNLPTNLTTLGGEAVVQEVTVADGDIVDYGLGDQYRDNFNQSLTLVLSIPVFNGLNQRSNVQRSKIAVKQAELAATEQRNVLYQNIETAYRNARAAAKTYDASNKQVSALQETFRTVENQYNLGAINFTDYQVAANNLFQAQTDLSRAKYDFIFRLKVLDFYQGKALEF